MYTCYQLRSAFSDLMTTQLPTTLEPLPPTTKAAIGTWSMDTWDLSNTQNILPDRILESSKLYPKVSQAVAQTLMTSLLEIFGLSDFLPTIVECVPQPSTLPRVVKYVFLKSTAKNTIRIF